jgi:hypothetical protein
MQADILEIQAGFSTPQQCITRRGGDPEGNLRAKADWLLLVDRIAKEKGVPPEKLYATQIPGQNAAKPNNAATDGAPENGGAEQEDAEDD